MNNKFLFPLDLQLFGDGDPGLPEEPDDDVGDTNEEDVNEPDGPESKTFSQEELDTILKGRIAKERERWEKLLEESKTEAEKLAKMSEKEKKEYKANKRLEELDKREAAITRRELTAQAKVQLADKGIPTELADILNFNDAESCNKSIKTVVGAFQSAVEKAVEEKLKGGQTMKSAANSSEEDEAAKIYKIMMGK